MLPCCCNRGRISLSSCQPAANSGGGGRGEGGGGRGREEEGREVEVGGWEEGVKHGRTHEGVREITQSDERASYMYLAKVWETELAH